MGGMQKAMVNLANGLAKAGITVEMYALFRLEHFFDIDVHVRFSESQKPPESYNLLTRMTAIVGHIRKTAQKSDAQTIIVYGKFYAALTLLGTFGLKKRIFFSDRASPLNKDYWYIELLTKLIFSFIKPTGIIAQTNDSAQYQRKRFGAKTPIAVIPNAVTSMIFPVVPKKKQVLAVGRFGDSCKGFDLLIEAWGKVTTSDWNLVFAGGTAEQAPELVTRAKELGIANRISFLGKVKDMPQLYAESEIFVIPSRSEGFPNALVEAMVAGLACVSFDFTAGPRDIIDDGKNGYIVPKEDTDAFAEKIQYLIDNPLQRLFVSANAKQIEKRFNSDRIIGEIINFIA